MIIDFHTHAFPDSIAEKAIAGLAKSGNITPRRQGTLDSLKQSMKKSNVDYSVVLPVATTAAQVDSINHVAAKLNGKEGIIYAGAVHPDCDDIDGVLDSVLNSGLFGVKVHPDFQDAYFDDERYLKILNSAADRGLYVITHAGIDVSFRDNVHCTPDMILNALNKVGPKLNDKLILAHMGSYEMADRVLEKLAGKPVYMDTSAVLDLYPEKCVHIIKKHGADRILFATDSPWADQKEYVDLLKSMVSSEDAELILSKNALKILTHQPL
ncbi:MAG: TatD family hydrolase [Eubacteriaceae bacterium]|nr:TatD family hydrolase [Eubacteriaceae bacterium]